MVNNSAKAGGVAVVVSHDDGRIKTLWQKISYLQIQKRLEYNWTPIGIGFYKFNIFEFWGFRGMVAFLTSVNFISGINTA